MFPRDPSGAPPRRIARRCEGTRRKDPEEGRGRRWPSRGRASCVSKRAYRRVEVGSRKREERGIKRDWGIYAPHMRDAEWGGICIAAMPMEEKENGRKEDKGRVGNGEEETE